MNTLSATTSLLTHSLAWALLYSLWQGALIYGTLFVLLKALPNVNARIKYYLSYGAFSVLFLWFADTWATQYQKLKGVTVYITQSGADIASTTYTVKAITPPVGQTNIGHHYLPGLEQYFPLIIILYGVGLAFMFFRFLVNVLQVKALREQGIMEPGTEWLSLLQQLQDKFDISRPVQLFLSSRINVPMMLGVIKPIILLPVATINSLSTEQVEAILLHELAHIKRHDYLLNILQTIAETILFFNPFVWLVSAIIRREREHCCDDLVVARSISPLPYAKALAILESNVVDEQDLTLAATGKKKQLFNRIKRIMEMKKSNINYSQLTIIIVAILAIAFSVTMFTFSPSFAQQAKTSSNDTTTQKKSVYKYKSVTIDENGNRTETVKESDKPIKEKMKDDDSDNDVEVNVTVSDDSGKKTGTKAYSYSYSTKGDEDIMKIINETVVPARDVHAKIIYNEVESELDKINDVDWKKVSDDIKKGLDEINKVLADDETKKELTVEVKKILESTKMGLEKDEEELPKSRQMQIEVRAKAGKDKAIAFATDGDEEASAGTTDFEPMLGKMEKDGLIDRSKSYKIEKENGALYINGEKQPAELYNKYKNYLKGNHVTIKGNKGSLNINVNN